MLGLLSCVRDLELDFSEWLTVRRRQLGLTQKDLAEQLGVSRQTINNWETGKVEPTLSVNQWRCFCDVMKVERTKDVPKFKQEGSDRDT